MEILIRFCLLGTLLSAVCSLPVKAQWSGGVEFGPDVNSLKTNIANVPTTKYVPTLGYQFGLPFQYRIKRWFLLETEPSLLQKNDKLEWSAPLAPNYEHTRDTYLKLPVMADIVLDSNFLHYKFHCKTKFSFTAQFGVYIAYWQWGRIKGTLPDPFLPSNSYSFDSAWVFNTRRDERWEMGWLAGGRLAYSFQKYWQLFVAARYYQSGTDQRRNYETDQVPQYNRTWTFSVGALFKLSCK
jgi:hypothetical protein